MDNGEKMKQILDGIGLMGEIAKLSYNSFIQSGFPAGQALELTKTVISAALSGGKKE
jgi:hypothetical protein